MLGVGSQFPSFCLLGTVSSDRQTAFQLVSDEDFPGLWKVYFFWPKDFTFICPTEIAAFARLHGQFTERGAVILGASLDSEYVHLAWRQQHPDLLTVPFPMLSDIKRDLSSQLGILDPVEGVAQRAIYLVDPAGTIRYVCVHDLLVGRNPVEVLRVLDALLTDDMCPCNWQEGEPTLAA
jgi:peroxiredoxin (alkyl hydroperoxide reductase subunit C)